MAKRDKHNPDVFWLRDKSIEDSANLPEPDTLAEEIMEDLRSALEQFEEIYEDMAETLSASDWNDLGQLVSRSATS